MTQPLEPPVDTSNPYPRFPCVLLLDTSSSMKGKRIEHLAQGYREFISFLQNDRYAKYYVEIAVIEFGASVTVTTPFTPIEELGPRDFRADGLTPLAEAIETGIDLLLSREKQYRTNYIRSKTPWLVIMSDGNPTDSPTDVTRALSKLHKLEEQRKLSVFPLGIGAQANIYLLNALSSERSAIRIDESELRNFLQWLSVALTEVSRTITLSPGQNTVQITPIEKTVAILEYGNRPNSSPHAETVYLGDVPHTEPYADIEVAETTVYPTQNESQWNVINLTPPEAPH
ncbi:MAG: VWA domain-containing protein [Actinomycetaceae bacterium]|nr:VWA domain-containing protein [Actinomycetaceae bacterium]